MVRIVADDVDKAAPAPSGSSSRVVDDAGVNTVF